MLSRPNCPCTPLRSSRAEVSADRGFPGAPPQLSQPVASSCPLQRPCVSVKGTCFLNQTCPFPQFSSSAGLDGRPGGARVGPWRPQLPSGQGGGQRRSRRWTGTQCRNNRAGVKKAARPGCLRPGERGCRRPHASQVPKASSWHPFSDCKPHTFFFCHNTGHVGSSFPDQGLNPCPLQWMHRVLTTAQPGKPPTSYFLSQRECVFAACMESCS